MTLLAAGDIAACDGKHDGGESTARLLDREPGIVLALGDVVQRVGAASEYTDCYDRHWGRHKDRTYPAIGNHEYGTDGANPYWDYWGIRGGERGDGWYAVDLSPDWRLIVLNAMQVGERQLAWLDSELVATTATGVIAAYHHPLLADANPFDGGIDAHVRPFVDRLYAAGASIILNGHRHVYERFGLMDPDGKLDPGRGIRQFVVGSGGFTHHEFYHDLPASRARNNDTFGVLKLTLAPGAYAWEFLPIRRKAFADRGSGMVMRDRASAAVLGMGRV